MKNKIAKILFAISFLAAPMVARADLIWYEGFNYPAPVIVSGTNNFNLTNCSSLTWVNFSGSGLHDMYINTNGYNKLEVAATSAPNGIDRKDDDYRRFATTPGSPYTNTVQKIYASFTVICTNLPNGAGSYFASIYNTANSGGGFFGRIQAFTNGTVLPNTWRLGVTGGTSTVNPADGGYPVDLALNTPYQVVEELDPLIELRAATIWVNPINLSDTGLAPNETHYTSSDSLGTSITSTNPVNAFAFRQAGTFGNAFFVITNLALATTFAEAATNVCATNARPPVIVYQPTAVISNFVGAAFNLSAVANGQGLGSLTYQWQVSATPDDASPADVYNPNGNTNVFSFAYADVPDSGYYTLVVKTPYGLTATSSVAKVAITAALVPPSFITQPVSQTVYKGQTVTFSTSVSSPGNVTFTWYSNNVVVTDGQTDNGYSSSYVFNNVQTSSVTNRVAVTNDVVPNGVVSTNAVLTVLNPQQVTIAYLRSLADPGNGYYPSPNPSTIPYQITGTVTTFTNTTSGNTASYYLQDGTAGINIFATGAQTFRPAQGAVVTFVGLLSGYTSGLEIYANTADDTHPGYLYTSYLDTGTTNALPTPISIGYDVLAPNNITNVNLNIAESLVKLTDVYFGTNAGTIITNRVVTVTNSAGQQFKLQTFALDLDTLNQTFPVYASSVTGVLSGINTNFTLAITRFADIVTTPPPPPPTIIPTNSARITGITMTNLNVVITGTNAQATGVYYLLESTNVALPLSQWITVATNVVGTANNFTFIGSNVVTPGGKQQFYILSNTNSNHP